MPSPNAAELTADAPVVLSDCRWFDLAPRAGGAPYRIFLRTPPGEAPASGWPVLYLLDGNAMFATAVDAIRVQAQWPLATGVADAAIVGVGYPTDGAYDSVRRSWDYGPPPGVAYPPRTPDGPEVRTGGAAAFLAFLDGEVKPQIERRVPIDRARQALFGHSFGGLFALYALFERPEMFSRWIAVSPTIHWEDFTLLASAGAFETRTDRPRDLGVLIPVGEYEQTLAPFQIGAVDEQKRLAGNARSRTEDHARAMAARLDALKDVSAIFEIIKGDTHMTVLPTAVNQAIRFAFGSYAPHARTRP